MNLNFLVILIGSLFSNLDTIIFKDQGTIKKDSILKVYDRLDTNNGNNLIINQINELAYEIHPSDYIKSFQFAKKSLELAQKSHYKKGEAEAFHIIGISFNYSENYVIANEYQDRCISIAKKINDKELIARAYNAKALSFYRLNDFKKAHHYYDLSITYLNQITPHHPFKGAVIHNIAALFDKEGKSNIAINYFDRAISYNERYHNQLWLGQNYYERAIAYMHISDYRSALSSSNQSLALSEKFLDLRITVNNLNFQADFYSNFNDFYKSERILKRALSIVKVHNFPKLKLKVLKSFSLLEEKKKNFKSSLVFEKEYNNLYDSLYNVDRYKQLDEFRTYFEAEQTQKENTVLKRANLTKELQLQNKNYFILVVFLLLSLSFYLIYLIYKNSKKLGKNNLKLTKQNREINHQKSELEELNHFKSKFFSIISHDLRGPLSSLSGMFRLFEEGHLTDEELNIFMLELGTNFKNTSNLVDNLLVWGKSQMQGEVLCKKRINLSQICDESISIIASQYLNKNLKFSNNLLFNYAFADVESISAVIRNLINNAAKFTPKGGEIAISSAKRGDKVILCIKDNGVGLTHEQKEQIFNHEFYSSKGTQNESGTGLGLMICEEFIHKNGGEFWVESEKSKGSSFYFSVPLKK
nr:tetratricopeptide repeat-containing sensor histidine kinase [Pseudopedobacter sp.]